MHAPTKRLRLAPLLAAAAASTLLTACGSESAPEDAAGAGSPQETDLPPAPATNPLSGGGGREAAPDQPSAEDRLVVSGIVMTIPDGWVAEPPASSMRIAQFRLPAREGAGADDATLAMFRVPGGGIDGNIDRWIGQLSDITSGPRRDTIERDGLTIGTVDAVGSLTVGPMMGGTGEPQPGTALLGAVIEGGSVLVQLKLTGPSTTIDAHRARWDELIGSIAPAE